MDGFDHGADAEVACFAKHAIGRTDDQIDGGLGEGVVLLDLAGRFSLEEFVAVFRWRQEADAIQIDAEAVDEFHAECVILGGIVIMLDPGSELAVERFERREIELTRRARSTYRWLSS